MKRSKKAIALMLAAVMASGSTMTVFAGQWMKDDVGYWWQEDDGSYPTNTMKWIDADGDTVAEGYYFDENGYVYQTTTVGDGTKTLTIDEWMQTQMPRKNSDPTQRSEGYDPTHPLAGKIDEWNLRQEINPQYIGGFVISNESVQARLTGQMDYYNYLDIANYAAPVDGWYNAERNGTTFHISVEDYEKSKMRDQALYEWYCNWLNGMDFENMTEMEKLKEIHDVLAQGSYDSEYASDHNNTVNSEIRGDYAVLINKTGICGEYAMAACSLAKALGLKCAVNGSANHAWYYIQADGKAFMGENQILYMTPTNDSVYFQ